MITVNAPQKNVSVNTVVPENVETEASFAQKFSTNIISETKNIMASVKIDKKEALIVMAPMSEMGIANKEISYYDAIDGNISGCINFNTAINYYTVNDDWDSVVIGGEKRFIKKCDISDENPYTSFSIGSYTGTKTYESYTAFGSNTPQQRLQNAASTDDQGFRRLNDRYMVALGSRFTKSIGQYFDLVLANGTVIPCMLSDQKSDVDTDPTHTYTITNGSYCCSEFCVDTSKIKASGVDGDISKVNGWNSPVVEIRVYNYNYFAN